MIQKREIRGKEHRVVVLKVTSSYPDGRPKTCEIGYDETVFDLEGEEEFITAWVPTAVITKVKS